MPAEAATPPDKVRVGVDSVVTREVFDDAWSKNQVIDYNSADTIWEALTETGGCVKALSANWLVGRARSACGVVMCVQTP